MRWCNPESPSSYNSGVFGYEVDVKTSRGVFALLPEILLDNNSDDDIVVMVRHRDNENSFILLGRGRTETPKPKTVSQEKYSGEASEKLDHLAVWPMNELIDLGSDMAYMNQKPENPFSPGDHVKKKGDKDASIMIVIEVLPPEQNTGMHGVEVEGEAASVTSPSSLDEGPGNWETVHPVLYASYCYDQNIRLYICRHSNLEFAKNK